MRAQFGLPSVRGGTIGPPLLLSNDILTRLKI